MNGKKAVFLAIGLIIMAASFLIGPVEGLSKEGVHGLGIFFCAICLWIGDVFPFFVTCLAFMCTLILTGTVTFAVGFQGFTSSIFCFILGALGMSVAFENSGLLKRLSLCIMKLFSPTFRGQTLGLLATGIVISPVMPSVTAKTAILMPFSRGIAEAMGYAPRSKGMHGIYSAAYCGVTLGCYAFYTASFFAIVARGMMPAELQAEFGFVKWFTHSLLWLAVTFLLLAVVINVLYRPKGKGENLTREYVSGQLKAMGKMSRKEIISLVFLVVCVILWALDNRTGLPSHVIALAASMLMIMMNVITVKEYLEGVSWNMVLMFGVLTGLGGIFGELGIDDYVAKLVAPVVNLAAGNATLLIASIMILIYVMRFFLTVQMAAIPIFMSIFMPICQHAGISPFIVAFITSTSCALWTVLYQNTLAMQGYAAYGGEANIKYSSIAKLSVCYMAINLVAVLVNIPVWHLMGLIG